MSRKFRTRVKDLNGVSEREWNEKIDQLSSQVGSFAAGFLSQWSLSAFRNTVDTLVRPRSIEVTTQDAPSASGHPQHDDGNTSPAVNVMVPPLSQASTSVRVKEEPGPSAVLATWYDQNLRQALVTAQPYSTLLHHIHKPLSTRQQHHTIHVLQQLTHVYSEDAWKVVIHKILSSYFLLKHRSETEVGTEDLMNAEAFRYTIALYRYITQIPQGGTMSKGIWLTYLQEQFRELTADNRNGFKPFHDQYITFPLNVYDTGFLNAAHHIVAVAQKAMQVEDESPLPPKVVMQLERVGHDLSRQQIYQALQHRPVASKRLWKEATSASSTTPTIAQISDMVTTTLLFPARLLQLAHTHYTVAHHKALRCQRQRSLALLDQTQLVQQTLGVLSAQSDLPLRMQYVTETVEAWGRVRPPWFTMDDEYGGWAVDFTRHFTGYGEWSRALEAVTILQGMERYLVEGQLSLNVTSSGSAWQAERRQWASHLGRELQSGTLPSSLVTWVSKVMTQPRRLTSRHAWPQFPPSYRERPLHLACLLYQTAFVEKPTAVVTILHRQGLVPARASSNPLKAIHHIHHQLQAVAPSSPPRQIRIIQHPLPFLLHELSVSLQTRGSLWTFHTLKQLWLSYLFSNYDTELRSHEAALDLWLDVQALTLLEQAVDVSSSITGRAVDAGLMLRGNPFMLPMARPTQASRSLDLIYSMLRRRYTFVLRMVTRRYDEHTSMDYPVDPIRIMDVSMGDQLRPYALALDQYTSAGRMGRGGDVATSLSQIISHPERLVAANATLLVSDGRLQSTLTTYRDMLSSNPLSRFLKTVRHGWSVFQEYGTPLVAMMSGMLVVHRMGTKQTEQIEDPYDRMLQELMDDLDWR